MAELTAEQIAQRAFDQDLLDDRQLQEIWGEFGRRNVPVEDFVQLLLRRELLTNFQLDRLLKGERAGYFYGDYKVLYMVSGGSFARVYRAVHKDTGVVRAVKVLRKRYSDSPEQTEHFCREGQVGITLRHPNIVPIYEVSSKGMTHFLVMEFIEGRNLREFLKIRKKLDPAEATRLMIDIASGLRYAVEHGVSHRDLKLTNILVSSKGQAKLVDFGLAATDSTVSDDVSEDQLNQRTIDYAGLERATGARKDDPRSDIYFLGCIYYHMLIGKPPLQETRDRIQRLSKTRFQQVVPVH
ncbi:MAG TPA: serine/threonine-protein kinase, partial [Pirellulales bacterium]|nr:serine/threonine-protein kinase [Pirellulales bacterium]